MILQELKPDTPDEISSAEMYYYILSSINRLDLTPREVQLISFMVIKGNMLTAPVKKEFCDRYDSTVATIGNMVRRLKKKSILLKEKGKIKVNPAIVLDFSKQVVLKIML